MPVILVRNLAPLIQCNGTQIRVVKLGNKIFEGEIISGKHAGTTVVIPCIPLQSKDHDQKALCQFTC